VVADSFLQGHDVDSREVRKVSSRVVFLALAIPDGIAVRVQEQALNLGACLCKSSQALLGVLLAQQIQRQAGRSDLAGAVKQGVRWHSGDELRPGGIHGADIGESVG